MLELPLKQNCILLAASFLLSGCSKSLLEVNCQYQPIRGQMIIKKVKADALLFSFRPSVTEDLKWFKKKGINTDQMEMKLLDSRRVPKVHYRYDAIVNLKTSGPCTPYITYPGRKL